MAPIVDHKPLKKTSYNKQNSINTFDADLDLNFNIPKKMSYDNYSNIHNSNGNQFYEMSHKGPNKSVKAKTYIMIHTEYEGAKKSDRPSFDSCNCQCCKNNTIQNMFKEVINKI